MQGWHSGMVEMKCLRSFREEPGETAEKMIKTWKQTLAAVQVDCEIPISAAVGYAIGEHEKLKNVIAEADRNMYACKHAGRNSTEK